MFRLRLFQRGMTLGVRVIATNEHGHVLLVRHGYTPGWHLPGGGVDYGETMDEAGRRELEEETGYRVDGALLFRGICLNARHWKGDHVGVYVAPALTKEREVKPTFEIQQIGFYPLDALPAETTPATRARLNEWRDDAALDPYWSPPRSSG